MKSMLTLMAATAALLAANASTAIGQEVCSKSYVACMDACVVKQSKMVQESCINSCQQKNDQCSEKIYGARPAQDSPVRAARQPAPAKDAMAKDARAAAAEAPPPAAPGKLRPPANLRVPAKNEAAPAARKQ